MTPRRLTFLAAAVALTAAACATSSTIEAGTSEDPAAIIINSGGGNVSVTATDSGVAVTADGAAADDSGFSAEMVGSDYVIDDGCGGDPDCKVDLTIEVAGTADVTINSSDGTMAVIDMNSTVTITGTASNVALTGITGPIDVDLAAGDLLGVNLISTVASFQTGAGDLDVTLTESFQSLSVTSSDGNVTAQVPDGEYDIDATTDDGGVEIDVDDVEGAAAAITMRTDSGDVTIYRR